jgi:hypothetical protein
MSREHPYRPPKARVEDTGPVELGPRPLSIRIALVLIVLFALVAGYHQFMRVSDVNTGEISGLRWVVDWFWSVAIVVTAFLIARAQGWARWVLLALALYDLYELADALLFMSLIDDGSSIFFVPMHGWVMLWMGQLSAVGATILVFGPGRGWFQR